MMKMDLNTEQIKQQVGIERSLSFDFLFELRNDIWRHRQDLNKIFIEDVNWEGTGSMNSQIVIVFYSILIEVIFLAAVNKIIVKKLNNL
jgi:hypothetical protein